MDRIFYSVEKIGDRKALHVFSEIYYLDNGEEKDYRLAEYTGVYFEFKDLQGYNRTFDELICETGNCTYENALTEYEANEFCEEYFSNNMAHELDIYNCNQNTPCGNYWCEMQVNRIELDYLVIAKTSHNVEIPIQTTALNANKAILKALDYCIGMDYIIKSIDVIELLPDHTGTPRIIEVK